MGSPSYYDSYYGGYYPETYGYAPYATDYGYRAPADYAYRAPAQDAYRAPADSGYPGYAAEDTGAPFDDRDGDGVADAADGGRLRLDVRPADATIYVDDQFQGTAGGAAVLTLAPGRHTVEATRPGFQSERRVVEVGSGEARSLSIALQPGRR